MKSKFITFDYFIGCLIDPMWEVFRVLDDKEHPENRNLIKDLHSIDSAVLEEYHANNNIEHLILKSDNVDQQRRAYYYINYLHQNAFSARIEKLADTCARPSPYDKRNLIGVEIDKNNLCIINQFNLDNFGIQKDDYVYNLCPILEQTNSSYWVFKAIINLVKQDKTIVKVRLDPFIEIPSNNYHPILYRMIVYGKPLNWRRILKLRDDEFGQWFDEKPHNRYGITEYIWSPHKNEIHFTCEELPKISFERLKTSRYLHAIFNKKTGNIQHCDGALRLYTYEELITRSELHLRDPRVRKIGKRIKIFQFDSAVNHDLEINKEVFCSLTTSFFVWNYDVLRYFN